MNLQTPAPVSADPWRFSVAPMMDWTDRHCRVFHRQISHHARLYTEMITTSALVHGNVKRLLRFDKMEHPVALQLGGSDADDMARSAELGERFGYDEININCGCPSDRVQEASFGACLMKEPDTVADCVAAMRDATSLPVTVKSRIGIDDSEEYEFVKRFVATVAEAGCDTFIIHARKAWLQGLSPKENREIPPLHYDVVYRLKQEFPQLRIAINGGIKTLEECEEHLKYVDGVMLGREAYDNPWMMSEVDSRLFGTPAPVATRADALLNMREYVEREVEQGTPLGQITRHILGLYRSQGGGRVYRRFLSEHSCLPGAGFDVIEDAIAEVQNAAPHLAAA